MTSRGSKQFNFYCLPDELEALFAMVKEASAVVLGLPCSNPRAEELNYFPRQDEKWWIDVLLCPKHLSSSISFNYIKEQGYYLVDEFRSPVIELARPSLLPGNSLRRSRLYMHCGYWDRDENWIEQPKEVGTLYHRLVSFVRNNILTKERRLGSYASNGALEFERQGGVLRQI